MSKAVKHYTCISHSRLSDNFTLQDVNKNIYNVSASKVKELLANPAVKITNIKLNKMTMLPYIDTSMDDEIDKFLNKAKIMGLEIVDLHADRKDEIDYDERNVGKVYLVRKSHRDFVLLIKSSMAVLDAFFLFGDVFTNNTVNLKIIGGYGILNAYTSFNSVVLNSLDLSDFDSSNIVNMSEMFFLCNISHMDLSSFNTSSAVDMSSMFYGCNTDKLDISNFDTTKVQDISNMFSGCNVNEYNLGNLDLHNCTKALCVFTSCTATELDISGWKISNDILNTILRTKPDHLNLKTPWER